MRLTTLQLRLLKPCESTESLLSFLPEDVGWNMFRFEVKIPTKLWKAILRRRKLVTDASCCTTYLTLAQALTENDIDIRTYEDEEVLDIINSNSNVRSILHRSVYVTPLDTELFDRFDISVLRSVVLFRSPTIINFNVVLRGVPGASTAEAVFDVSRIPDLLDRPAGALVSYAINV